MLTFPNSKINLGLSILNKREDGFHSIETVFYPVALYDVLEIIKSPNNRTVFSSSGLDIPGKASQNLCLKAYYLLKDDFDLPPIQMHLHKVIPMGAGLGGGSSDAAQTLLLLNSLFELKLTQTKLLQYASKLGADCAFFILNKPAFATERGDKFKVLNLDLSKYQIVIVKPDDHVNTAEAYAGLNLQHSLHAVQQIIQKPVRDWRNVLVNDFEKSVFRKYPRIAEIKTELYNAGAIYASMSGSGSAVFALFENPIDLSSIFKTEFYWSSKN